MRVEHAHSHHFWLRGEEPPETVQILADPAMFSSDTGPAVPAGRGRGVHRG